MSGSSDSEEDENQQQHDQKVEAEKRNKARHNTGKLLDAGIDDRMNESESSSSGEYYSEEEGEEEYDEMDQ